LKVTNACKYLGVTLQTTKSYRIHIKERVIAATKGLLEIKNLRQLSLETAIRLFEAKIVPLLTYGIEIAWPNLSLKDVKLLENVKARFLKITLGISKYTPSRLADELAKETFLMEDLRYRLLLPSTENSSRLIEERKQEVAGFLHHKHDDRPDMDRTQPTNASRNKKLGSPRLPPQDLQNEMCAYVCRWWWCWGINIVESE
jgi:hypothetical protein